VEFGAADGMSCSNTAKLWHDGRGWKAYLIEADPTVYAQLVENVQGAANVVTKNEFVERSGDHSIDALLADFAYDIDYMSIDVDGEDYAIFQDMQSKPRVVSIEYNQSIPSHMKLRQDVKGDYFGASALVLCKIAKAKGYELIGLTKANLFFVEHNDFEPFIEYERNLEVLFPHEDLTYLITDYAGRPALVGAQSPPWGLLDVPYLMETVGVPKTLPPATSERLKAAWEEHYGASIFLAADGSFNFGESTTAKALGHILDAKTNLIIIDVTQIATADYDWIFPLATEKKYVVKISGSYVVLIREDIVNRPV